MEYELVEKLVKAGYKGLHVSYEIDGVEKIEIKRFPYLHELIESCGDKFGGLHRLKDKWLAFEGIYNNECEGKTSREAVANLWLKIKTNL